MEMVAMFIRERETDSEREKLYWILFHHHILELHSNRAALSRHTISCMPLGLNVHSSAWQRISISQAYSMLMCVYLYWNVLTVHFNWNTCSFILLSKIIHSILCKLSGLIFCVCEIPRKSAFCKILNLAPTIMPQLKWERSHFFLDSDVWFEH